MLQRKRLKDLEHLQFYSNLKLARVQNVIGLDSVRFKRANYRPACNKWLPIVSRINFYEEVADRIERGEIQASADEKRKADERFEREKLLADSNNFDKCQYRSRWDKNRIFRRCACIPHHDFVLILPAALQHRVREFWKVDCREVDNSIKDKQIRYYPFADNPRSQSPGAQEFRASAISAEKVIDRETRLAKAFEPPTAQYALHKERRSKENEKVLAKAKLDHQREKEPALTEIARPKVDAEKKTTYTKTAKSSRTKRH